MLRQQIRNYYGDPLGTGVVRPRQQLRQGGRLGVAGERGRDGLDGGRASPARPVDPGMKAIVLDVDDTTLATWNYEIFSNWAYNPTTNAHVRHRPAVPGRCRAWSTW